MTPIEIDNRIDQLNVLREQQLNDLAFLAATIMNSAGKRFRKWFKMADFLKKPKTKLTKKEIEEKSEDFQEIKKRHEAILKRMSKKK